MAVDMFLVLSNNIKGEAQDSVYKDSIDVIAWSWGMSQSGTTHMGAGGGGGKVSVQDMSLTKYVDMASTDLMKHCASGAHIDKAELIARKSGGDKPVEYMKITMEEVIVSSVSVGGSADGLDRFTETISLNFARFNVEYKTQGEKGVDGGSMNAGWDIAANVAM